MSTVPEVEGSEQPASSAVRLTRGQLAARIVGNLPDRVPLLALSFFVVASVAVAFHVFLPWLVLPAFAIVAAATWRMLPLHLVAPGRPHLIGSIASLGFALVWFFGNVPFRDEWFNPSRDPGIYLDAGFWLSKHPSAGVDLSHAIALGKGIPQIQAYLSVFTPSGDGAVHLQGGDLLPAVIGASIWIGGAQLGLLANLVLGMIGLLAVYGLARRVVGPLWAIVPQVALGLSMPYMYFSRGTYTEVLMVVVAAAGLTWLISGVRSSRARDFAIAGVFLGTSSLARVDGPLTYIGAGLVLAIAALGFVDRDARRRLFRGSLILAVSFAVVTALGVASIVFTKPDYVVGFLASAKALWGVTVVVVVVTVLFGLIGMRLGSREFPRFWNRFSIVGGAIGGLVLVVWFSRPLWFVSRHQGALGVTAVATLQKEAGVAVDGTRSYEEQTMAWIGWYFGWPMLVLAMAGFVFLIVRGVRRRDIPLLIAAAAPLLVAAVYFTRVSITPDQLWAYRRLLPVITPGFLIAAVFPLAVVWERYSRRWIRALTIVLAASVAFAPLVTWNHNLLTRDDGGERAEIAAICNATSGAKTVVFVRDSAPANFGLPIRTVCNVDVISFWARDIDPLVLQKVYRKVGAVPVIAFNLGAFPGGADFHQPVIADATYSWIPTLTTIPDEASRTPTTAWVGTLDPSGIVLPTHR